MRVNAGAGRDCPTHPLHSRLSDAPATGASDIAKRESTGKSRRQEVELRYRVTIRVEVEAKEAEDEAFRLLWLHFYQGQQQGVEVDVQSLETG